MRKCLGSESQRFTPFAVSLLIGLREGRIFSTLLFLLFVCLFVLFVFTLNLNVDT